MQPHDVQRRQPRVEPGEKRRDDGEDVYKRQAKGDGQLVGEQDQGGPAKAAPVDPVGPLPGQQPVAEGQGRRQGLAAGPSGGVEILQVEG